MLDTLAQSWLTHQCRMIPNVTEGVAAFNVSREAAFNPTACFPEGTSPNSRVITAAELAMTRNSPVVQDCGSRQTGSGDSNLVVAYPLLRDGHLFGVVAIQLKALRQQQQAVIQLLHWGAAWLELLMQRDTPVAARRISVVIESLFAALSYERLQEAAMAAVTELARQLSCERVSLGLWRNQVIRLQALSHSAHFESRSNLIRNIEAAMEEALVQDATITYPPLSAGTQRIVHAHTRLAQDEGKGSICTVTLNSNAQSVGALTLERGANQRFDPVAVELCEVVAKLMGPVIEMKRRQDRPLLAKVWDTFAALIKRFSGPHALRLKLGLAALLGVCGFLILGTGEYRIAAPATLEGTIQRAVVAPFDGYIAAANVRAGETVKAGEIMAELDDKELKLERRKWSSQRGELDKQYRKALATLDHTEARILRTQVAQAETQLELVDEQLARTRLFAPIDGAVITGDLSRALGTPVERGQTLFEIAPLDEYRVVLEVDERDIADVNVGQHGFLVLSSMSAARFELVAEKVSTVSQADEGYAAFRVEAHLEGSPQHLRPGMQGIAKLVVGRRNLAWIWTRKLIGWAQLRLWAWLP